MTDRTGQYVECDIPPFLTIREWRAMNAAPRRRSILARLLRRPA